MEERTELGAKLLTNLDKNPFIPGIMSIVKLGIRRSLGKNADFNQAVSPLTREMLKVETVGASQPIPAYDEDPYDYAAQGDPQLVSVVTVTLVPEPSAKEVKIVIYYKRSQPTEITLPIAIPVIASVSPSSINAGKWTRVICTGSQIHPGQLLKIVPISEDCVISGESFTRKIKGTPAIAAFNVRVDSTAEENFVFKISWSNGFVMNQNGNDVFSIPVKRSNAGKHRNHPKKKVTILSNDEIKAMEFSEHFKSQKWQRFWKNIFRFGILAAFIIVALIVLCNQFGADKAQIAPIDSSAIVPDSSNTGGN